MTGLDDFEIPTENMDLRGYPGVLVDPRMIASSAFTALQPAERWLQFYLVMAAWREVPAGSLPDEPETLAFHARLDRDMSEWARVSDVLLAYWVRSEGRLWFPPMMDSVTLAYERREKRRAGDAERKKIKRAEERLKAIGVGLQGAELRKAAEQFLEAAAARGLGRIADTDRDVHVQICSQLGLLPSGIRDITLRARMSGTADRPP
ncbi:MAG: hypothetical protein AAF183_12945 [Pseudomonadota bacterium]